MSRTVYIRTAFTGGGAAGLDGISGASLADGAIAFVIVENRWYNYVLDSDSGLTENSPFIIAPDLSASTKRWILQAPAIIVRDEQGDPSCTTEGIFVINTYNNNFKVYADAEWRILAEWG